MPRVLLVTYPWLPAFNAGVRHAAILCRYLPDAGWNPIVLTRDWSEGASPADDALSLAWEHGDGTPSFRAARAVPVVHAAFTPRANRAMRWRAALAGRRDGAAERLPTRIARATLEATWPIYGDYPDAFRGWVDAAVPAGIAAIRQYGINAVVSLSPPDSAHIAAGRIARAAGVPWIPLFGELGTFATTRDAGGTFWQRLERRELGRRWLRGAARAGAVSPAMTERLRADFGLQAETFVVPFDPEERRLPPRRTPGAPMRLVHVGRVDPAGQAIGRLLDALDALLGEDPALAASLQVELVGSGADDALRAMLLGRPAAAVCAVRPRVSRGEAIILQREADALLLFDRPRALVPHPATLFEQLNARRPTIALAEPDGFVARVLAETRAGVTAESSDAVGQAIRAALDELRTAGEVGFRGDDAAIARYSGAEQARRLAALLDVASAERIGSWQRG